jgi:hypothetical protein
MKKRRKSGVGGGYRAYGNNLLLEEGDNTAAAAEDIVNPDSEIGTVGGFMGMANLHLGVKLGQFKEGGGVAGLICGSHDITLETRAPGTARPGGGCRGRWW